MSISCLIIHATTPYCKSTLSDESDIGLHRAPVTEMQERSNTTKQMMAGIGQSGVFQKSGSGIDLRAVLCLWYNWDTDVMCMKMEKGRTNSSVLTFNLRVTR